MDPIAFHIGDFAVHWYGILVGLGFLVGLWTASRRALHAGISAEAIIDLGPWIMVGAVVGARALYVYSYWHEYFAKEPISEIFKVYHGGLVFYGGLIGASLAVLIYLRIKQMSLWKTADVLAPSIALGQSFGRVGCLMNGCCYGKPTDVPWAIHFPVTHVTHGVGVHPTEIYSSLLNFVLFLGLAWLFRRRKFDGQVFGMYLIGYSLFRGFVEFFRGDYPVHYVDGLFTPAQLISAGVLLVGLSLLWWRAPAHPCAQTSES